MHAWLSSPTFNEDLENLYLMTLPSNEEVELMLSGDGSKTIYHETVPSTAAYRVAYREGMRQVGESIDAH